MIEIMKTDQWLKIDLLKSTMLNENYLETDSAYFMHRYDDFKIVNSSFFIASFGKWSKLCFILNSQSKNKILKGI